MAWTGTGDPWKREPEAIRQQVDAWCKSWAAAIAKEAGGLNAFQHSMIYLMLHEIRRRILADDLGPPLKLPPAPPPDLLAAIETAPGAGPEAG